MIDGQVPANGWFHAEPGYTHAPTLSWRGGIPYCGVCVTPITNPDWPAARPLTLPGRAQATTNEARDLSAADSARPLPRPGSVSGRLLAVLREHACGWSPCGVGCEQDIMEKLRARGILLADFGPPTAHDED